MKINRSIEKLNLSDNHLSDEAIPTFGELAQQNATLKKVDFTYNNFTEVGIIAMREALMA